MLIGFEERKIVIMQMKNRAFGILAILCLVRHFQFVILSIIHNEISPARDTDSVHNI